MFLNKNLHAALSKNEKVLAQIIKRALKIKANAVTADEKENGPRAILNFGHTIGHALETISGYAISHGQAVALGILAEARLSLNLGVLRTSDFSEIKNMLSGLIPDLPDMNKNNLNDILKLIKMDKKNRNGEARFVLIKKMGKTEIKKGNYTHKIPENLIITALKQSIYAR